MNKTFKLIAGIFIVALALVALSSFSSAYSYYDDGYSRTFYEKTSYGETGNSYIRKEVTKNDGYQRTSYVHVKDSDNNGPVYANDLNDYWYYGSNDYSVTRYYADRSYDDSYRRSYSRTSYHDYYYDNYPRYNGNYYSWSYKPHSIYIYSYPRCNSNIGCHW